MTTTPGIYALIGTEDQVLVTNNTTTPVLGLPSVSISPGSYSNVTIQVDAYGRICSIQSGAIGPAPVTVVSGEATLSGTNLGLASTAVIPGTYTRAKITVDSKGRITSVQSTAAAPTIMPSTLGGTGLSSTAGLAYKLMLTPTTSAGTALNSVPVSTSFAGYGVPLRVNTAGTAPTFLSNSNYVLPVTHGGTGLGGNSGSNWAPCCMLFTGSTNTSIGLFIAYTYQAPALLMSAITGNVNATAPVFTTGYNASTRINFVGTGNGGVLCAGSSSSTGMQITQPTINTGYALTSNGTGTLPTFQPFVAPATNLDQTAGTSTTFKVMPSNQQYHLSAAKAWCRITVAGTVPTLQAVKNNVGSVSRSSIGVYVINFSTPMSTASYMVMASAMGIDTTAANQPIVSIKAITTTSCTIVSVLPGGTFADFPEYYVVAFGSQ